MRTHSCDVLIVGAGSAGAHLASLLGRSGFSVILLDKNSEGESGAHWVNGIPAWIFDKAQLEKPRAGEVHSAGARFTLIDPTHQARISIPAPFLLDINMRIFGDRLIEQAQASPNVRVFHDILIKTFELDVAGRPRKAYAEKASFEAELFVDVSGLSAVVRKNTPYLKELCPVVEPKDLCRAAQEIREIKDPHGALNFLESNQGQSGEILSWVGVAGGFSLLRVQVSPDLRTVAFLTGTRALFGVPSGAKLIQNFVNLHAWVGEKIFGGQRAIPIRHPYAHLVAPGVALLGDSACQIYPAHGSGIGVGLLAAKLLATGLNEAAKEGRDLGSLSALWPYAYQFHQEYGALLVVSDLTRRFSQSLSPDEVHQFIASGMMTGAMLKSSLLQQQPEVSWREFSHQIKALTKAPSLAIKSLWVLAKIPQIMLATRQYPAGPDLPKALAYERRLSQLL